MVAAQRREARSEMTGFCEEDRQLARFAKALSAPAKVAILRALAERNSCICGEVVKITPLSQSTVSQHLSELKELGLIQGEIKGVTSCYCINREGFARFADLLSAFVKEVKASKSGKAKQSAKKREK